MQVERPRTRALFDRSARDVEAAGHRLTPREAVWLHAAVVKVTQEGDASPRDWMPQGINVGGITLRELSIGAHIWLNEYAGRWWEGDRFLDTGSVAFASVHGQTPGYLARLTDRRTAERRVYALLLRVTCPVEKLRAELRRILRIDDVLTVELPSQFKRLAVDPSEWGSVIAAISAHYGLTPEHILALPRVEVLRLLEERNKHVSGEAGRQVDGHALASLYAIIQHLKAGGDESTFKAEAEKAEAEKAEEKT